jgi:hypothetical protein
MTKTTPSAEETHEVLIEAIVVERGSVQYAPLAKSFRESAMERWVTLTQQRFFFVLRLFFSTT